MSRPNLIAQRFRTLPGAHSLTIQQLRCLPLFTFDVKCQSSSSSLHALSRIHRHHPFSTIPTLRASLPTNLRDILTTFSPFRVPSTNMRPNQITPYTPRHDTYPYTESSFSRLDSSPDTSFYDSPRFVTHIDDSAIAALRHYFARVLPTEPGTTLLDFCSSWISHYPAAMQERVTKGEVRVLGMGMEAAELARNPLLRSAGDRVLWDLNERPDVKAAIGEVQIDAATCTVSIDYLTNPIGVLQSLRNVVKDGEWVHLIVSNRCFPTKAVQRWLRADEEERLWMCGDDLWFAGWKDIEVECLADGTKGDPLWVVRGRNVSEKQPSL